MKQVHVDLSRHTGVIRPMHAVNNAPFRDTFTAFREAGIPCCRNHDATFSLFYGGSHAHDVLNIFPNFDADENDPANYDFTLTDKTIREAYENGQTMLYRLGSKIEHEIKQYQTKPPKDFFKYARICEHIIRHYCYGWADGMELPIDYWEIWNEADNGGGVDSPCWGGPVEQFQEFYEIMAKYLKGCFPELKIGGPAYTGSPKRRDLLIQFVEFASAHKVPLDFFSWHGYRFDPHEFDEDIRFVKDLLVKNGFTQTETVLDEWNYVKSWEQPGISESKVVNSNEKGAAFNAASMLTAQKAGLDMFMYYDARPNTSWNGLFAPYSFKIQKPYYAFWQFNKLYTLKNEAFSESDSDLIYVGAAENGGRGAVQLAYFSDDPAPDERVAVHLKGLSGTVHLRIWQTDAEYENKVVFECVCQGPEVTAYLDMKCSSTAVLTVEPEPAS